jgi:hypothetical protein
MADLDEVVRSSRLVFVWLIYAQSSALGTMSLTGAKRKKETDSEDEGEWLMDVDGDFMHSDDEEPTPTKRTRTGKRGRW